MWIIISGCSLGSFGLTTSQLFHMACEQALHFESRASSGSRSFLHFRLACVAQKVLCLSSFHTNISWQWKKKKKKKKHRVLTYRKPGSLWVSQTKGGISVIAFQIQQRRRRIRKTITKTQRSQGYCKRSKNRPINSFFIGHFKAVIL